MAFGIQRNLDHIWKQIANFESKFTSKMLDKL